MKRRRYDAWPAYALALLILLFMPPVPAADAERQALESSQAALGNRIPDAPFIDSNGDRRRLSDFHGRPLVISMIYTSCVHACSVTTRHLGRVARIARNALGEDSFTVVTIGFDHPADTPAAMRAYARRHGVGDANWHFLSSDDEDVLARLVESIGFHYAPSPRGFDHIAQATIIDRDGIVVRQVYGETFDTPQLVEPLKSLVLGFPAPGDGVLASLGNRVRLFCTVYDARGDRYYFDYSLFAGIFIGLFVLGGTTVWLLYEFWFRRRRTRVEA